ncbi:Spy/CpxP family protein refolding chaperone, partial [candidate division FCPU426 bacterium]|nr:Spy/CpxP family protein refolding chaperone [candidate division FCPU426 bacterium]
DFGGPGTIPAELGLSDKQTEQIRSARTEGRKQAIPLQAELKTLHLDLREAMAADSPSERAIMEYADKISGVHGKLLKNRLQTELAVHSLLTPKQRKEWEKIRSQRHHGKGRDGKKGPQGTRPR